MTMQRTAPTASTFDYRTVQIPKGKEALYRTPTAISGGSPTAAAPSPVPADAG